MRGKRVGEGDINPYISLQRTLPKKIHKPRYKSQKKIVFVWKMTLI